MRHTRFWPLAALLVGLGCYDEPAAPAAPRRDGLPPHDAAVCLPTCDAVAAADERVPMLAAAGGTPRPGGLRMLVIVGAGELDGPLAQQLRVHLDGWGIPADIVSTSMLAAVDLDLYSSIVLVPGESVLGLGVDEGMRLAAAPGRGTDLAWIGSGLPAGFGPTFGIEVVAESRTVDRAMESFRWTDAARAGPDEAPVYDETYTSVRPDGAEMLATFEPTGEPALTTFRAGPGYGRAVLVPFAAFGYWDESPEPYAWARAELVFEALLGASSRGAAMLDPYPDGHRGALVVRLEDLSPGGSRYSQNFEVWVDRFEWTERELHALGVHFQLAVVARYADPSRGEDFGWTDPDPVRPHLLDALRFALSRGAVLISHGLTHQQGVGPMDYTGVDWEFSDEEAEVFLPYAEQHARIAAARDELASVFGREPEVWETPHLEGNADTYQAARDAGYQVMTEADGHLFPNRFGLFGVVDGRLLNVPHTGSFVPTDDAQAAAFLGATTESVVPRLVRLRAPFYVFYHGFTEGQADALLVLADCTTSCGFWTPTVPELATWWEARAGASVSARDAGDGRTLEVDVRNAPEGASITVRLADGMTGQSVLVEGRELSPRRPLRRDGIAYEQIALPAGDSHIAVRYVLD